jgi:hypothetical protein
MTMTPGLRKFALTAHITSTIGWLGAIIGVLALAIAALTSRDVQMVRGSYLAMELTGWYVLVPLCLASLATGLVMSLGTPWGLLRHYWVLVKFLITIASAFILFMYTQTLGYLGGLAADTTLSIEDLRNPSPVLHSSLALVALLVNTTLSVYKPWGMTRYGRRKQHEQRTGSQPPYADSDTSVGPGRRLTTGTPRWVKVFGIIALVLVLLFVILHLAGRGLGGHT